MCGACSFGSIHQQMKVKKIQFLFKKKFSSYAYFICMKKRQSSTNLIIAV